MAALLLDNGAMIDVPGDENETALHDAVNNGRVDCVRLLVSRGASLTLRSDTLSYISCHYITSLSRFCRLFASQYLLIRWRHSSDMA